MTYFIVGLVCLIVGFVIGNALSTKIKSEETAIKTKYDKVKTDISS